MGAARLDTRVRSHRWRDSAGKDGRIFVKFINQDQNCRTMLEQVQTWTAGDAHRTASTASMRISRPRAAVLDDVAEAPAWLVLQHLLESCAASERQTSRRDTGSRKGRGETMRVRVPAGIPAAQLPRAKRLAQAKGNLMVVRRQLLASQRLIAAAASSPPRSATRRAGSAGSVNPSV